MKRKSPGRIVRTLSDVMWKRDRWQMRLMDRLLPGRPTRRRIPSARRRPS